MTVIWNEFISIVWSRKHKDFPSVSAGTDSDTVLRFEIMIAGWNKLVEAWWKLYSFINKTVPLTQLMYIHKDNRWVAYLFIWDLFPETFGSLFVFVFLPLNKLVQRAWLKCQLVYTHSDHPTTRYTTTICSGTNYTTFKSSKCQLRLAAEAESFNFAALHVCDIVFLFFCAWR